MQRFGNTLMAGLTALVIVAMGCDADQDSNPCGAEDQYDSVTERMGEPYDGRTGIGPSPGVIDRATKWVKKKMPSGGGGSSGSSGAGGSFMTLLALGLLVGGGILSRKH